MKPLVIANFKMNPSTLSATRALIRAIERGVRRTRNVECGIAPPTAFLLGTRKHLSRSLLGAQNVAPVASGAWTGEVSARMLADVGVRFVIIGHSERRRLFGETDERINQKVRMAVAARLSPVVAIGEEQAESEAVVPPAIARQLTLAIEGIPRRSLAHLVVAYEPVWAIGTGRADTPDNATRRAIYIRKLLVKLLGARIATSVRILYGGSVTAKNARAFIAEDIRGMDGLLVGGASLAAREFVSIVESVGAAARRRGQSLSLA